MDDDIAPEKLRRRYAYDAIGGIRAAADLVPVRLTRFRERAAPVITLSHSAATQGQLVYARAVMRSLGETGSGHVLHALGMLRRDRAAAGGRDGGRP